ncbi:MAG: hypothetical protein R3A10_14450 [Caldilineaceae bacterium]
MSGSLMRDAAVLADVGGHPLSAADRARRLLRRCACSGVTTSMITPPFNI